MTEVYNVPPGFVSPEDQPPATSEFDSVLMYDNKKQTALAAQIILYLNSKANEPEFESKDCMVAGLVSASKFAVQHYYMENKRQFTEEHKKEILERVEKILNAQLNLMTIEQVFAH